MASQFFPLPNAQHDPERDFQALLDGTCRIIAVAHAMVRSRRPVDLGGLQEQVGLLCAKALDLPPEWASLARADLLRLGTETDALRQAMTDQPA